MASISYDALLLLGLLFFATALILPLNSGKAFSSDQYFYPLYLLAVSFFYFSWSWTRGGQTLGMRCWKIKISGCDGRPISRKQAALRFLASLLSWTALGCGFLWCLIDKNNLCWHDYLSKTLLSLVEPRNG